MRPEISVAARLGWGLVLSTLVSAVVIWFLTVVTGSGREFAPLVALLIAFVALPVTMLVNSWVLFVRWRSRRSLFLCSLAIPSLLLSAIMLYVHGYGNVQELGALMLAPMFQMGRYVGSYPLLACCFWLLALTMLFLMARARQR